MQEFSNTVALNRIALGFRISSIPVVPWPEYYGYATDEGRGLNETARDAGDDPNDWYVSEVPVDLMQVVEFWHSPTMMKPKLKQSQSYVADIQRMVAMCRETKGVYIPPSWLKYDEAATLATRVGLPIVNMLE